MTETATETRAVTVERDLPHPPEKVWRALTEPHLASEWLRMKADIRPEPGHRFELVADWGTVSCEVREAEPPVRLSYSWDADPLRSTVTFTLTPIAGGTRLRMEQTGFAADLPSRFITGATAGWPRMLEALETLLGGMAA